MHFKCYITTHFKVKLQFFLSDNAALSCDAIMMQSWRLPQLRRSFALAAVGGGLTIVFLMMSYTYWNQDYWKKAEDATMAMDFEGFGPERGL